jgi:tripartite-type tricarboxylate transporter receptor subunit TctC
MMNSRFKRWFGALLVPIALAAGVQWVQPANAQDYPSRPINLVVPFAPGGVNDSVARIISDPLGAELKQSIVVLNKGGVGGAIGTAEVAKGGPTGYNLLLANGGITIHPDAERISGRQPMYELSQVEPIALLSSDPMMILVRADSPYKTLADLIKAARDKPETVSYSSSGNFGPIFLSVELLAQAANVKFLHVPYKGGGPAVIGLLSGDVAMTTAGPNVAAPQIAAGKVRALAVSGTKRLTAFPEVPTYREAGFDAEYYIWTGIYGPSGMPPAVIQKLRGAIRDVARSERVATAMSRQGIMADYRDSADFKTYVEQDAARIIALLKKIGKID